MSEPKNTSRPGEDRPAELSLYSLSKETATLINSHVALITDKSSVTGNSEIRNKIFLFTANSARDAREYGSGLRRSLDVTCKNLDLVIDAPSADQVPAAVVEALARLVDENSIRRWYKPDAFRAVRNMAATGWEPRIEAALKSIVGPFLGAGKKVLWLYDLHRYPAAVQHEILRLLRNIVLPRASVIVTARQGGVSRSIGRLVDKRFEGPYIAFPLLVEKAYELEQNKSRELLGERVEEWITLAASFSYPGVRRLDDILAMARRVLEKRITRDSTQKSGTTAGTAAKPPIKRPTVNEQGFVLTRRLMVFVIQEKIFPQFHEDLIQRPDGTDAWLKIQLFALSSGDEKELPSLLKLQPWATHIRDGRLISFLREIFTRPRPLAEVIGKRNLISNLLWEAEENSDRRPSAPSGSTLPDLDGSPGQRNIRLAIAFQDYDAVLDDAKKVLDESAIDVEPATVFPEPDPRRNDAANRLHDVIQAASRRDDFSTVFRAKLLQARLLVTSSPTEAAFIAKEADSYCQKNLTNDPMAHAESLAAQAYINEETLILRCRSERRRPTKAEIEPVAQSWALPRTRFVHLRTLDRAFDCLRHETLLRLSLSEAAADREEFRKQFSELVEAQLHCRESPKQGKQCAGKYSVFLSYRHADADRSLVDNVSKGFSGNSQIEIWYDKNPPTHTDKWRLEILRQLWNADLIVFFVSTAFTQSQECLYELHLALALRALTNKKVTWFMLEPYEQLREPLGPATLEDIGAALQHKVDAAASKSVIEALRRNIESWRQPGPAGPTGQEAKPAESTDLTTPAHSQETKQSAEEEAMASDKQKHLEFIQSAITRMATNSFLIRGWSISLAAALIALAAKDRNGDLLRIAYLPCITFWMLDGYYLSLERKFRALYSTVAKTQSDAATSFSMDTSGSSGPRTSWLSASFRAVPMLLHLALAIVISLSIFLLTDAR